MHAARSLRVTVVVVVVVALASSACGGGGGSSGSSSVGTGNVDVKAACAALDDMKRSTEVLDGVDVADPELSLDALVRAIDAYSKALADFERVAPVSVGAHAARVRAAVTVRHFTEAEAARAPIDAWAAKNCG